MSVIKNLKYEENSFKLDIPHLEISDTGVTAITGPSGAGKTTLFNILTGMLPVSGWQWNFQGEDLAKLEMKDRRLGVAFQFHELFPHLSAQENIEIIMKARKVYNEPTLKKLETFKHKLKLEKCWTTLASHLSGGEKQRVSLLRAMMSNPRILLLDEPFSSLDAENKESSQELVKRVLAELSIPALMITHDLAEARYFTQTVLRIENGCIVA